MIMRYVKWISVCILVASITFWPVQIDDQRLLFAATKAEQDNVHLLAQIVCGEARGEPYEGQVAVAAVILNRTADNRFPNSVAGVVYETYAFESVATGEIYKGTTPECLRAAKAALAGWDPSYGAVFFFAPSKTNNAFIWSKTQIRTIGRHIFAK
jgi:N-acetylmuramoyl-L-alanine amidase